MSEIVDDANEAISRYQIAEAELHHARVAVTRAEHERDAALGALRRFGMTWQSVGGEDRHHGDRDQRPQAPTDPFHVRERRSQSIRAAIMVQIDSATLGVIVLDANANSNGGT